MAEDIRGLLCIRSGHSDRKFLVWFRISFYKASRSKRMRTRTSSSVRRAHPRLKSYFPLLLWIMADSFFFFFFFWPRTARKLYMAVSSGLCVYAVPPPTLILSKRKLVHERDWSGPPGNPLRNTENRKTRVAQGLEAAR